VKKRIKQVLCFALCFFFIFFISLYVVTLHRERSYDLLIESFRIPEEARYQVIEQERDREREYLMKSPLGPPLDEIFTDPAMIEYVAETHANEFRYEHHFRYDLIPGICERGSSRFPSSFFYVYGKRYSRENLMHVGALGFVLSYDLGPYPDVDCIFNDLGEVILVWQSHGNALDDGWLDKFLASEEYETFFESLCLETKSYEGKSLDAMVEEIQGVPTESHGLLSNLKTPFLKDAQELASVIYQDYQNDKQHKDITKITAEAGILQELYERVLLIKSYTPNQVRTLRWVRPFLPDPFVDLCGILVSSMVFSLVITYFVGRKYWK
jgi:hypothetical protein